MYTVQLPSTLNLLPAQLNAIYSPNYWMHLWNASFIAWALNVQEHFN